MAIPVVYNLRSVRQRWTSAIVAVLGISGTVGVFVAMLALAKGFRATVVSSGASDNALVMRSGANTEIVAAVTLDEVHVIEDSPGVARTSAGPLVTAESVVVVPFPQRSTGTDANVQVRGVSPKALEVRPRIRMIQGEFFHSGLTELVVGKAAAQTYTGLTLGSKLRFVGGDWTVVGIFDAGGTNFDSEVWCDGRVLRQVMHRPDDVFQSVTAHLTSSDALQEFKDAISSNPRMNVDVAREVDYYDKQSQTLTKLITVLGGLVAGIMGIGAVFGALNTMYAAVAERSREIATLRALGFGAGSVVFSFMIEALLISFIGGALGCLAVLPLNGLTTAVMNMQTFTQVAFAFRITPLLLGLGLLFAVLMGVVGGFFPAMRAARRPVAPALRGL
ncbi:MAG TPA: ABC transporter permease [Candidatus Angelobacter sp.]|nr:ABC transporter permease [Candidatus Angelobacter sp.]